MTVDKDFFCAQEDTFLENLCHKNMMGLCQKVSYLSQNEGSSVTKYSGHVVDHVCRLFSLYRVIFY